MSSSKLLILSIIILSACNVQDPLKTGKEGLPLPDFNIQQGISATYKTSSISAGKPSVFVYFRTNCPYCRAEIEEILDDINDMKDYNFFFVSFDTLPEIQHFIKQYNLDGYSNIHTGRDIDTFFHKYFNTEGAPYTVIYNKDRRLSAAFFGKIGPREIKKHS